MVKEFVAFVLSIIFFLVVGIAVKLSNFDFKLAEVALGISVESGQPKTKGYSKKSSDNSSAMKVLAIRVLTESGEKLINVDSGTSQLEVMAIFGKRFENILTISNYFKIINNGDVIDVR